MTYFFSKSKQKYVILPDGNLLYSCYIELGMVKSNLEYEMTNILRRFRNNYLKANPGKFQFMILVPSDGK